MMFILENIIPILKYGIVGILVAKKNWWAAAETDHP